MNGTTSLPELPLSFFESLVPPEKIDESFVGLNVSLLYSFLDDETNECGLDWYNCQITGYNETTDEVTVIWEEGGADQIQLHLCNYGVLHREGGWKFKKD
jgi:hypothetical protein